MNLKSNKIVWMVLLAVVIIGGVLGWRWLQPSPLPVGFAAGNGRIEGVEIDVATKTPGRILAIRVNEGDFVEAGAMLAEMDVSVLQAQRREAEANLERARIAVGTAESLVRQREAERLAAEALVRQREAERHAAQLRLGRTQDLAADNAVSVQELDDVRARAEGAVAAVAATRAQVAAAEAAIGNARSQVVAARSAVDAAQATIERIQADIDDSVLRSPRDGRVQYRIAQPGEVLAAGGRVLNLIDLGDVYMTFFLPMAQAGRVAYGSEARLVLDAVPNRVIPARISFVADVAQFTPKTVETAEERQKLMFRIKAQIDPELLRQHLSQVKTGLPGMAYVRLDPAAEWPPELAVKLAP
jgi:HlyD family secretion protein